MSFPSKVKSATKSIDFLPLSFSCCTFRRIFVFSAISPPTKTKSENLCIFSTNGSFVSIFAPPMITQSGLLGSSKTLDKTSTSFKRCSPAKEGINLVIPTIEAWFLCVAEKASFT